MHRRSRAGAGNAARSPASRPVDRCIAARLQWVEHASKAGALPPYPPPGLAHMRSSIPSHLLQTVGSR